MCVWCVCMCAVVVFVCAVRSVFRGWVLYVVCVWCVCLGYVWRVLVNVCVSVVCVWCGDVCGVRLCACVMFCVCGV